MLEHFADVAPLLMTAAGIEWRLSERCVDFAGRVTGQDSVDAISCVGLVALNKLLNRDLHGRRTAWFALKLGQALELSDDELSGLTSAAATHDIGKLFIPEQIIEKNTRLTPAEMDLVRCHTVLGYRLLNGLLDTHSGEKGRQASQTQAALLHHECWDGTGYPFGLAGNDIPLEARVVAVADVFDALTSVRSYKPAWPVNHAIDSMATRSGTQFDPRCIDALLSLREVLGRSWPTPEITHDDRKYDLGNWLPCLWPE